MDQEFEAKRVKALHKLNVLDTERDPDFDRITETVARVFAAPVSYVSMVDEGRLFFKSGYGSNAREIDRADTFCSCVIEMNEFIVVKDAEKDDRFKDSFLVKNDPFIKFYAGVPLRTSQGYPVGTLCFVDTKVRGDLDDQGLESLTLLGNVTMRLLELKAVHSKLDYKTMLPTQNIAVEQISDWINKNCA